jgi:hypothetical protein
MKKVCCPLLFVLLTVLPVFGSEAKIKEIRERYRTVSEKIDHEELLRHEIIFKTLVPGIGFQVTTMHFYYEFLQDGETGEILQSPLIKVTLDYSIAASVSFYIEYLFDETEEVTFYYLRAEGAECGEERFYFDNEKLVKVKISPLEDCMENGAGYLYEEYERSGGFSTEDHAKAKKIVRKAQEHTQFFDEMGRIEQLEK